MTNLNDAGAGSLRQAIIDAVAGDTIDFAVTGTITLTSGELSINKNLTIQGPGAANLAVSGNNASRVLNIISGTVNISGVTIRDGNITANAVAGGILNNGTLTLSNIIVSGNTAAAAGGIRNDGTLNLTNSTLSNNVARGNGGGLSNGFGGTLILTNTSVVGNSAGTSSGGIENLGAASVINSTVSVNAAGSSASGGGISNEVGTLTLTNSTIRGNSAFSGGGIDNNNGAALILTNSTVSNNVVGNRGGGIQNRNSGTAELTNSTISANSAGFGGGIFLENNGTASLTNSIIAENPFGGDCEGSGITSLGHNLDSDGTCNLTEPTDLPNTDPDLGPLQDNGGPTKTHSLPAGSPAIDAIPVADCTDSDGNPITIDQRGVSRPQGPACDIGAYEFEEPDVFTYSAKIVCVPHLGKAGTALMPGKYRTAVNVHNPSDEPAHIQKWVTLSPPQGQTPITGGRIADTLQPWSSFDVDCLHFRDDFWLPEGAKVPGGKGFMVIRSDKMLDVVAVYTSKAKNPPSDNGVGTSIDVERVEPKMSNGTIPSGPIHPPSGMVSWWSGDDHPNDIIDGNHGTLQGDATYGPGMVDEAFSFDGVDDYVSAPQVTNLDGSSFTGLTIDAWINPDTVAANHAVAGVYNSSVTLTTYQFHIVNGQLNFGASWDPNWTVDFFSAISSYNIPVAQWTHVAGTWSGGSNVKLYINGVEDTATTVSTLNVFPSLGETSVPATIGALTNISNQANSFFDGLIDEVEIFDRALSADEIRAIFEAGSEGKIKPKPIVPPSGMVSWWSADDHPNDIVDGNHGTLQGGATYAGGMVDQAFSLDGDGDYVDLGNIASLDFTDQDFTIDAWFRISDYPNNGGGGCGPRYPIFANNAWGYVSEIVGSGQLVFYKYHEVSAVVVVTSPDPVSIDRWHHFTAVHTVSELRLYVDGQLVDTAASPSGAIFYHGSGVDTPEIGRMNCGDLPYFHFKGLVDEVEIFDRALTDAEISAIYEAGPAGKIKP